MIALYCDKSGKDPKLVKKIIDAYFKNIKKDITSLDNYRYRIEGLGTFEIRKDRVEKKLHSLNNLLDVTPPTSYKNMEIYYKNLKLKEKLLKLLDQIEEENQRKIETRNKKWGKESKSGES